MQIIVRDNNVEQALRALKKKLQREGVYREMKLRRHYEKPSEKRARERAAAIRRARKLERKRAEREGAPLSLAAHQRVRRRSRPSSRPIRPGGHSVARLPPHHRRWHRPRLDRRRVAAADGQRERAPVPHCQGRQGRADHPRRRRAARLCPTADDGTVIDSSESHGGPQPFTMDQVFPGFAEAMTKMQEGGEYRFTMPQRLAFGNGPPPPGFPKDNARSLRVQVRRSCAAARR